MNENEISFYIRKSIFEIYNELGPGLLEKVYEKTLAYDLKSKGLEVKTQVPIPIKFKDLTINSSFIADIIVEDKVIIETNNPGEVIKDLVRQNKSPKLTNLPPFTGGFVGYFAYDYIKYAEPSLNLDAENQDQFKDIDLMLFDKVVAFDNFRQKIVLIANMKTDNLDENYKKACDDLEKIARLIKTGKKAKIEPLTLKSDFKPV